MLGAPPRPSGGRCSVGWRRVRTRRPGTGARPDERDLSMLIDAAARLEPEALRCPFPAYAELRKQGVTFVEAANAYLVTRAEDVDGVRRDTASFSSRTATGAPPIPPDSEMAKR